MKLEESLRSGVDRIKECLAVGNDSPLLNLINAAKDEISGLQSQNARQYNALAKMFLWQSEINDLMPIDLAIEVRDLLGEKMVYTILSSKEDEPYEVAAARLQSNP